MYMYGKSRNGLSQTALYVMSRDALHNHQGLLRHSIDVRTPEGRVISCPRHFLGNETLRSRVLLQRAVSLPRHLGLMCNISANVVLRSTNSILRL